MLPMLWRPSPPRSTAPTASTLRRLPSASSPSCARTGFGNLPVCVAKTQYSFSDNAKALGAPENFRITVRELKVSAGAHFVVALTGSVLTMPGLPKVPAAENIDVDNDGNITGLF